MYKNKNRCSGCNEKLSTGDRISAIVPNIEIQEDKNDNIHLKLSRSGIEERAMKIYCKNCLNIDSYISE